jgi:hypothetical protein
MDKRTRAYKEWKAKFDAESKGVGDTIEKVAKALKIDKVVPDDCGCDKRKTILNKLFPYDRPECLTEEEHAYLSDFFRHIKTGVSINEQTKLREINNRIFKENKKPTSCGKCVRDMVNRLRKLIESYN